jgi:hypothetical protein
MKQIARDKNIQTYFCRESNSHLIQYNYCSTLFRYSLFPCLYKHTSLYEVMRSVYIIIDSFSALSFRLLYTIYNLTPFYLSKDVGEIPVLVESNYSVRSNLMKMHLDPTNAVDIVLGKKTQPEENNTDCEN